MICSMAAAVSIRRLLGQHHTQGAIVFLSAPALNSGAALGDAFLSIEGLIGTPVNDLLVGDNNANELHGGAGNDFMFGQRGNDRMTGDAGNDHLYGGSGNDTFEFANDRFGTDTIHDWQDVGKAQDVISFEGQGLAFDDFTIRYGNGNASVYVTPPLGTRPGGVIIIENVAIGSIGAGDFLF